jgi:hypothetical protein
MRKCRLTAATLAAVASFHATGSAEGLNCRQALTIASIPNAARQPVTPEDLMALIDFGRNNDANDEEIMSASPDGRHIAVSVRRAIAASNRYCSGLFVIDLHGGASLIDSGKGAIFYRFPNLVGKAEFPTGIAKVLTPRWSPDGRTIAFLKLVDGVVQVWRAGLDGAGGPVTHAATDVIDFRFSPDGGSIIFRTIDPTDDPNRLTGVWLTQYLFDDWLQIRVDGKLILSNPANWMSLGLPPGKCERGRTWYGYPSLDLKPFLTRGQHEIWLRVAVGGNGEAMAQIDAAVDTSCDIKEEIVDLCAGYAADPKCDLRSELVDGVATITNGVGTGLHALPSTRLFGTGSCTWQITRPFYDKARQYRCLVDTGSPTPPDLSRGTYILDHSTDTLLADRTTDNKGTVSTSTRSFALPSQEPVAVCETICKTRVPKANADAALDSVVGSKQTTPIGWSTFYHACLPNNVCPMSPGEELISACGCLDDFPEAMVMMQTVRLGGADIICTQAAR